MCTTTAQWRQQYESAEFSLPLNVEDTTPPTSSTLVSLNGVDYNSFPDDSNVVGMYAISYYTPCAISRIDPPGGPVAGGTLINFYGGGLADFGQEFPLFGGKVTPTFLKAFSTSLFV